MSAPYRIDFWGRFSLLFLAKDGKWTATLLDTRHGQSCQIEAEFGNVAEREAALVDLIDHVLAVAMEKTEEVKLITP